MCNTCGCSVTRGNETLAHEQVAGPDLSAVQVLNRLVRANDHEAAHNREHLARSGVLAINLMSSPGSGKTSLLEGTAEALGGDLRFAVIEGDLETENDAERIRKKGIDAVQVTTGTACHLDAHLVHRALHDLDLAGVDVLFIENVGNLVCPASFDLGHHLNVALLSTTEGDDKPAKYPVLFRSADLVLVTKDDLLEVLGDFSVDEAVRHVRELANPAPVWSISTRRADGLSAWVQWLRQTVDRFRAGQRFRPSTQPDGVRLHAGG